MFFFWGGGGGVVVVVVHSELMMPLIRFNSGIIVQV